MLQAVGLFIAGALVSAIVAWGIFTVARPPSDPLEAETAALVTVEPGEVGNSISLTTIAEWVSTPIGVNRASGVVTRVEIDQGTEVSQGSVLYRVDERPVAVAQGAIPAFRDIGDGAEGADVTQLQQMLTDLGLYSSRISGEVGPSTVSAIRSWQKSLGLDQSGVVGVSDVVFVPTLPVRVTLDSAAVRRGAGLVGGEQTVYGLPSSPVFRLPVTTAQAQILQEGLRVEITSPSGGTWTGYTASQTPDATAGTVQIDLSGGDAGVICGDGCGEVPVASRQSLVSRVILAETVSGLTVPSSAVVSTADGELAIIDETGERLIVSVVSSARGMSVIEGVESGVRVRVPGDASR